MEIKGNGRCIVTVDPNSWEKRTHTFCCSKKKSSLFVEGPGKKAVYPPIFQIPSFQIFGGETTLQLQFSFKVVFFFFLLCPWLYTILPGNPPINLILSVSRNVAKF